MKTLERFEQKIMPEPMSGCWLWTASLNDGGYGLFCLDGKDRTTHRVSWRLYRGEIPEGLCVLHKCDTRACVNPDHLFLGTYKDNNNDCVAKKRHGNLLKTHCKNGHELSGYNLVITKPSKNRPIPFRKCRECMNAAQRRQNKRKSLCRASQN